MLGSPEPSPGEEDSPAGANPPVRPGPVALVGSGEYLDVMVEVDRQLLAGRAPRAVLLPTASAEEGPERVAYWQDLGARHFERLGAEPVPLPVLTREDASREDSAALVSGAGIVYLSGGNPGYLAKVLKGSLVWDAIVSAWRTGTALAGCSAGACALSYVAEDIRAMRGGRATPDPAATGATGLALVGEVAVIPHFDRMLRWAPDLAERYADRVPQSVTVVGVDEDTAVVTAGATVDGERHFVVAGRQSAWVVGADGSRTEHASGSTFSVPGPG